MFKSVLVCFLVLVGSAIASATEPVVGADTDQCLSCHLSATPGIVSDWKKSRHARVSPSEVRRRSRIEKRVSAVTFPEEVLDTVVGCAECHTLNRESHPDTFDHNGFLIHTVVSPKDCAVCHPVEEYQYGFNLMAHAYGNLMNNPVYRHLAHSINAEVEPAPDEGKTLLKPEDPLTNEDSCLVCHGTVVKMTGLRTVNTIQGEMDLPVLEGWPNLGTGRINPDGSKGACTPCHSRHQFSIELARKPYACAKCHIGPDVPVYKVYFASKHGNVFDALEHKWDFDAVPWTVGRDFNAPTCSVCHVSLLVNDDGEVLAERTHQMNDRKAWRLFGLIYAHPEPKSPDTTVIRNSADLPLPTDFSGEPASTYLISKEEQEARRDRMQRVCLGCHGTTWVSGHFKRLDHTLDTTNAMTLASTKIMEKAWAEGLVSGPARGDGLFNEGMEKKWMEQWLFYANSTRFASAMMGADYGVFADGRWSMSKNVQELVDQLRLKSALAASARKDAKRAAEQSVEAAVSRDTEETTASESGNKKASETEDAAATENNTQRRKK